MQRRRGRIRWRRVFTIYGLGGKQFFSQTIMGIPEDYQRLMDGTPDIEGLDAGEGLFHHGFHGFFG
jgi:hypothetical protein